MRARFAVRVVGTTTQFTFKAGAHIHTMEPFCCTSLGEAAHFGHLACLRAGAQKGLVWTKKVPLEAAGLGHMRFLDELGGENLPREEHMEKFIDDLEAQLGPESAGYIAKLRREHPYKHRPDEQATAADYLSCLRYARDQGCPWAPGPCTVLSDNCQLWDCDCRGTA